MRITLDPVRPIPGVDENLSLERDGEKLIINGQVLDLSVIPNGASLPAEAVDSEWVSGPIERVSGKLHVTIRLPVGPGDVATPAPINNPPNGPIQLPEMPA